MRKEITTLDQGCMPIMIILSDLEMTKWNLEYTILKFTAINMFWQNYGSIGSPVSK